LSPYRSPSLFAFFAPPPPSHIYTLSLHDALPICPWSHLVSLSYAQLTHSIGLNDLCDSLQLHSGPLSAVRGASPPSRNGLSNAKDRKSTRLNSSHDQISYAVFCLKKKKKKSTLAQ